MPKPVEVKALPGYRIWLRYDDGAQGEIELAVAVDVVGSDTDIVGPGLPLNDGMPLPGGILVPNHTLGIDDDDVELLIGVDVDQTHRVAHAQARLDLLNAKRQRFALSGRGGRGKCEMHREYESPAQHHRRISLKCKRHQALLRPVESTA